MNRRLMTILLAAFVVAAGASFVVYRLVRNQINSDAKNRATKVVVAARNLEIGALIKATDLRYGQVVGEPPAGSVLKTDIAVGRGVISPLYEGEPVVEKRLAPIGSGGGLAATIPAGMRACAVKVDDVVAVAGFAGPGARVDVLISGTPPGAESAAGPKVRTLLQNIEVLSAGTNFQRDNEGKPVQVPVVNLLVTPDQAEVLSLASSNGTRIQLVLRNPIDNAIAKPPGTALATLFGVSAPKAPTAPIVRIAAPVVTPAAPVVVETKPLPPTPFVIQVLNGGKQTEQKFELEGARR
jgi:pilus assembly protein CpaB